MSTRRHGVSSSPPSARPSEKTHTHDSKQEKSKNTNKKKKESIFDKAGHTSSFTHDSVNTDCPEQCPRCLLTQNDMPPCYRRKDIFTGYRAIDDWPATLRSLFQIHNETGNIWTHLGGFLLFIYLAYWTFAHFVDSIFSHRLIFSAYICTIFMCLGGSATYHWLHCANTHVYHITMILDYSGITALIVGSFFAPLFFGFECWPVTRALYLSMITTLGLIAFICPWFPAFHTEAWHVRRVLVFAATTVSGFFPAIHSIFVMPHYQRGEVSELHIGIGLMFAFYGIGVLFYLSRFPESVWPGRFDIWFSSHQIWHVFVLLATIVHFYTCVGLYQRYTPGTCALA